MGKSKLGLSVAVAVAAAVAPSAASAFCGFYVSGAEQTLYANATMVVLMRQGTTTALSMQNNYQGPPEDFAMVVPVPEVLSEETVKVLPHDVFDRVDELAAPRLVEYWEQDPCYVAQMRGAAGMTPSATTAAAPVELEAGGDYGVRVEAEFAVGEYDVVILSASDSNGLDRWLRDNDYRIPEGAEDVLRPYVESGTKFFVAKVDVQRVRFEQGQAVLSPLRFHYDTDRFALPVRLGLLNSGGEQDLIVHVLAPEQRYEVANYDNATIPTNLVVTERVSEGFPSFYEGLFRETLAQNPGAVVTEYAWSASSCDPCPTQPLQPDELQLLGNDVLQAAPYSFVLTRLHYRYGQGELGEDLVFRAAEGLVGGQGTPDREGKMGQHTQSGGSRSSFQGRYAILHAWEGPVSCDSPSYGVWGGPPSGGAATTQVARNQALSGQAPAPISDFREVISGDVETLSDTEGRAPSPVPTVRSTGGCAGCSAGSASVLSMAYTLLIALGVGLLFRRRR